MALKALMLRKKIDAKNKELEALREKANGFTTREAELETAIGEAQTEEEMTTVEGEVESLTTEREANDAAIADLEGEIAEMESELSAEEERQKSVKTPANTEPETRTRENKEVAHMPIVKRFAEMTSVERTAFRSGTAE